MADAHRNVPRRRQEGGSDVGADPARMEMISEFEVQELLDGKNLITIGTKADEVRRRLHGARTTFIRVFEIHIEAPVATLAPHTSAGEFRIVGRPASLDLSLDVVRRAKALAGAVPLTGFSLSALSTFKGSSLPDTCRQLRAAGLDGIAETPLDELDESGSISLARDAGLFVTRLTVNAAPDRDRGQL